MKKFDYSKIDDAFMKENEWLLEYTLGKYKGFENYEDLLQEARIWIMEAKCKYKNHRSAWKTFVCKYINWKYNIYMIKQKRLKNCPELSGYKKIELYDDIDEDKTNYENDSNIKMMYDSALDCLPEGRDKEILKMHLQGYHEKDIGKKYDISHTRVWQIYHKQINIIKECMKNGKSSN